MIKIYLHTYSLWKSTVNYCKYIKIIITAFLFIESGEIEGLLIDLSSTSDALIYRRLAQGNFHPAVGNPDIMIYIYFPKLLAFFSALIFLVFKICT